MLRIYGKDRAFSKAIDYATACAAQTDEVGCDKWSAVAALITEWIAVDEYRRVSRGLKGLTTVDTVRDGKPSKVAFGDGCVVGTRVS
jgi:hypothetical protein